MSTPRCTLACSRCNREIPVGVLYGPCASCRAELNAGAAERHTTKLDRVAGALAVGWRSDEARRCWARLDPCQRCAGRTPARSCSDCHGTGQVEAIVEWENAR